MIYEKKVTICIPTYNRATTISNSIKSLLNQSYKNIELLIVDNASTDNTKEVVLSFNDPRIRYKYFSEHLEVNYSFMRALKCARTEIVCLFHSDDYYFPNIIEEQIQYIINPKVGAVFSKMINKNIDNIENIDKYIEEINKDKLSYEIKKYKYTDFLEQTLVQGILVSCPTLMTKKSVIEKVGLFEKKDGLISDLSLWIPIAREFEIIDLQKPLMIYGISNDQLSYKIHYKRCIISPQFSVLDSELQKKITNISYNAIKVYNKRKINDYRHICKNSFLKGDVMLFFKNLLKYLYFKVINIKFITLNKLT